jgi:hypothetical protein
MHRNAAARNRSIPKIVLISIPHTIRDRYDSFLMSVLVRFGFRKAILAAGRWTSADPGLEAILNDNTRLWFQQGGGPPLRDSDQESAVAAEMAARFDGRITVRLRSASSASNRIFLAQRQMELDFNAPPIAVTQRPRRRAAASRA